MRRSTNLEVVAGRDLAREHANAIDAATPGGGRGDETTDRLILAANHRFNRLSLSLRGGLRETTYDGDPFAAARNFTHRKLTGRAAWAFRPTLTAFAEVGYDRRDREGPTLDDGLSRSSHGERVRLGLSFGQTGEILCGEAGLWTTAPRQRRPARRRDIPGRCQPRLAHHAADIPSFDG